MGSSQALAWARLAPASRVQRPLQVAYIRADASDMKLRFKISKTCLRVLVGVLLSIAIAIPALASTPVASKSGNYRGQCRKLTKQIDHYEESILPLAIERGNLAWERATNEQIARLWNRRADLCPAYGAERTLLAKAADRAKKFNKMIALAGRAALAYFTGGVGGGL